MERLAWVLKIVFKIITTVEYSLGKKRNKINTVDLKQW